MTTMIFILALIQVLIVLVLFSYNNGAAGTIIVHSALETNTNASTYNETYAFDSNFLFNTQKGTNCQLSECDKTGELKQTPTNKILSDNSVACVVTETFLGIVTKEYTGPQSFGRCFELKQEGCSRARSIRSIAFGVELVKGGPIQVTVNVYKDCGCRRGRPKSSPLSELIGGGSLLVNNDDSMSIQTIPISNAVVAKDDAIFVEIRQVSSKPSDVTKYQFFPGTTDTACASTYHMSACTGNAFVPFENVGASASNLVVSVATKPTNESVTKLNCCVVNSDCASYEDCTDGRCVLKDVCANPVLDTCTFYRDCLEADLQCGPAGYPLEFGEKMCNVFLQNDKSLSAGGKKWSSKVRKCLQDVLVGRIYSQMPCPNLLDFAYNTHPSCYVETGFCDLLNCRDYFQLLWWMKSAAVAEFGRFRNQMWGVLSSGTCSLKMLSKCDSKVAAVRAAIELVFKDPFQDFRIQSAESIDINEVRELLLEKVFIPMSPPYIPSDPLLPPFVPMYISSLQSSPLVVELVIMGNETVLPGPIAQNMLSSLQNGTSPTSSEFNLTFNYGKTCVNSGCEKLAVSCGANFTDVQVYKKSTTCKEKCVSPRRSTILRRSGWKRGKCPRK